MFLAATRIQPSGRRTENSKTSTTEQPTESERAGTTHRLATVTTQHSLRRGADDVCCRVVSRHTILML